MGLYNLNHSGIKSCLFAEGIAEINEWDGKPSRDSFDYYSPSLNPKVLISISGDALVMLKSFEEKKDTGLDRVKSFVRNKVKEMKEGEFVVDTNLIRQFIITSPQSF